MKHFLVGSKYFFSCYPDFTPKDEDIVEIIDSNEFSWLRVIRGCGRCLFQFNSKLDKNAHIQKALEVNEGLVIGKFLVPEFCQAIGFGVEDLNRLRPLIDRLDERHLYEQIIYESYIQNQEFVLSEEQRRAAYNCYKEARKCQI